MKLFPEASRRFLDETGRYRTKASRATFKQTMAQLQSRHPSKHLKMFTSEDLRRFCDAPGLSSSTIKGRVARVRGLFEWAAWRGMLDRDPSIGLKFTVRPGNQAVRQHRWLTEEEVRRVRDTFPDTDLGRRDRLIFMIGVFLGLRLHEIAALRRWMFSADYSEVSLTVTKGKKLALMGVPRRLQEELLAWAAEGDVILPRARDVTVNWNGERELKLEWTSSLSSEGIAKAIRRAGDRAGIKLRPHDLRRTFAGLLEDKGMLVQDISRAMRHSNVAITSRYLELNPRKTADLTRRFDLDL